MQIIILFLRGFLWPPLPYINAKLTIVQNQCFPEIKHVECPVQKKKVKACSTLLRVTVFSRQAGSSSVGDDGFAPSIALTQESEDEYRLSR